MGPLEGRRRGDRDLGAALLAAVVADWGGRNGNGDGEERQPERAVVASRDQEDRPRGVPFLFRECRNSHRGEAVDPGLVQGGEQLERLHGRSRR